MSSAWGQLKAVTAWYAEGRKYFTQTGYNTARLDPDLGPRFQRVQDADLSGKTYLITGAGSGLGSEVCRYLALHGASRIYMVGRNASKLEGVRAEILTTLQEDKTKASSSKDEIPPSEKVEIKDNDATTVQQDLGSSSSSNIGHNASSVEGFLTGYANSSKSSDSRQNDSHLPQLECIANIDVGRKSDVIRLVKKIGNVPLDGALLNAGNLHWELAFTEEGFERTLATHLFFGCFYLASLLLPLLRQAKGGSNLVFMSSGGMYNVKLPLWKDLLWRKEEEKTVGTR